MIRTLNRIAFILLIVLPVPVSSFPKPFLLFMKTQQRESQAQLKILFFDSRPSSAVGTSVVINTLRVPLNHVHSTLVIMFATKGKEGTANNTRTATASQMINFTVGLS